MTAAYQRILYYQRPVSGRHSMAVRHRAKQFAPFAALRGFEETVRKKEIMYEARKELPDEKQYDIDQKLRMIRSDMMIKVIYYSEEHEGDGLYRTVQGKAGGIDPGGYLWVDNVKIPICDICDIYGETLEMLELSC